MRNKHNHVQSARIQANTLKPTKMGDKERKNKSINKWKQNEWQSVRLREVPSTKLH